MKFFIDENVTPVVRNTLTAFYRGHQFRTAEDETLRGVDDLDLFADLHMRNYQAIITQDAQQLINPDERAALRAHGLHWIGVPMPKHAGPKSVHVITAALVAGLSHFLDQVHLDPHLYRLRTAESLLGLPEVERL